MDDGGVWWFAVLYATPTTQTTSETSGTNGWSG